MSSVHDDPSSRSFTSESFESSPDTHAPKRERAHILPKTVRSDREISRGEVLVLFIGHQSARITAVVRMIHYHALDQKDKFRETFKNYTIWCVLDDLRLTKEKIGSSYPDFNLISKNPPDLEVVKAALKIVETPAYDSWVSSMKDQLPKYQHYYLENASRILKEKDVQINDIVHLHGPVEYEFMNACLTANYQVITFRYYWLELDAEEDLNVWHPLFDLIDNIIWVEDVTVLEQDQNNKKRQIRLFAKYSSSVYFVSNSNPLFNTPTLMLFYNFNNDGEEGKKDYQNGLQARFDTKRERKVQHLWMDTLFNQEIFLKVSEFSESVLVEEALTSMTFSIAKAPDHPLEEKLRRKRSRINQGCHPNHQDITSFTKQEQKKLLKIIEKENWMEELILRNNLIRRKELTLFAPAFASNKSIKTLNLTSCNLTDAGARILATGLAAMPTLTQLNLANDRLTNAAIVPISQMLATSTSLTWLDLSLNFITELGCSRLMDAVLASRSLAQLYLFYNFIDISGSSSLVEMTKYYSPLRVLDVRMNGLSDIFGQVFIKDLKRLPTYLERIEYTSESWEIDREIKRLLQRNPGNKIFPDQKWDCFLESNCGLHSWPTTDLSKYHNITHLILNRNQIQQVPPSFSLMTSVVFLDLSQNKLNHFPSVLLSCPSLKHIDLRFNEIIAIPNNLNVLLNLNTLWLQGNKITTFPVSALQIPFLRQISLLGNPQPTEYQRILDAWSRAETELDLSNIGISELIPEVGVLQNLKKLNLANNKIETIPPEISQLAGLEMLDISGNKIQEIPWQIGLLQNLTEFIFDGNPFADTIPQENISSLPSLLKYFRAQRNGSVPSYRSKLMVLGEENVGKTTLLRNFSETVKKKSFSILKLSSGSNISTDGIDIHYMSYSTNEASPEILFTCFDLAGQEVYLSTHSIFLSHRSIFLVTFSVLNSERDRRIEYWINMIKILAEDSPFFLVGTHVDSSKSSTKLIDNLKVEFDKKYGSMPNYKGFFPVSNKTKKGVPGLKESIYNVALKQPYMGEVIPKDYIALEQRIVKERLARTYLSRSEFERIAELYGVEQDQISELLQFFHNLGLILYFSDKATSTQLVVLSPEWLTKLMATLITTKQNFVENAILHRKNVAFVWTAPLFPPEIHNAMLTLLESFDIAYRLPQKDLNRVDHWEQLLIPILLKTAKSDPGKNFTLRYRYKLEFVSVGLFARLMIRIFKFTNIISYSSNLFVVEKDGTHIQFTFADQIIDVLFDRVQTITEAFVINQVNSLLSGVFKAPYSLVLPCTICSKPDHFHTKEDLVSAINSKWVIKCGSSVSRLVDFSPFLAFSQTLSYVSNLSFTAESELATRLKATKPTDYSSFLSVLYDPDLGLLDLILPYVARDELPRNVASDIFKSFHSQTKGEHLITILLTREIEHNAQKTTLFREGTNSVVLITSLFQEPNCVSYIQQYVLPFIQSVRDREICIELDPSKDTKGILAEAVPQLAALCSELLETLFQSQQKIPRVFKYLARVLSESAHMETDQVSMYVGSFFFLRFIIPVITAPQTYGISVTTPVRRTFVLVSKLLQAVSNGVMFGEKEVYLIPLNFLLSEKIPLVQNFLLSFGHDLPETPALPEIATRFSIGRLYLQYASIIYRLFNSPNINSIQQADLDKLMESIKKIDVQTDLLLAASALFG